MFLPTHVGLIGHLVSVGTVLLSLLFSSMVLRERRSPGGTWAWLLLVVLLPYIGIPLYFVIGNRKLRARLRELSGRSGQEGKGLMYPRRSFADTPAQQGNVERILLAAGARAPSSGNRVELISGPRGGEIAFERLLAAVRGAREELDIGTFILGGSSDPVARAIIEELAARARAGVRVRLLVDGFGALWMGPFWKRRHELGPLIRAGAETALFRGPLNLRNHRKCLIADGREALIGGMNLAQEYLGPRPLPARWLDLAIRVEGPAVREIQGIFLSDWNYAVGASKGDSASTPNPSPPGEGSGATLQIVPSGPDLPEDSLYDAIVTAAFSAKRRLWISTPYFVPDETLGRALTLACKRELEVKIAIPARSNHRLADFARISYLRQIRDAGGEVRLYFPGMLHAKALLVDDEFALVGSANMDMRSLLLNYELGAVFLSKPEIAELEKWFQELFAKTRAYEPRSGPWIDAFAGVGRIIGPML